MKKTKILISCERRSLVGEGYLERVEYDRTSQRGYIYPLKDSYHLIRPLGLLRRKFYRDSTPVSEEVKMAILWYGSVSN